MKDYVKCCNCSFVGKVDLMREDCPQCKMEGSVAWVDENNQEVEDSYVIQKGRK